MIGSGVVVQFATSALRSHTHIAVQSDVEDKPSATKEHEHCVHADAKQLDKIRAYAKIVCAKQNCRQVEQVGGLQVVVLSK